MRNRDMEAFLLAKRDAAPVPEFSLHVPAADTGAGSGIAALPGLLRPAARSRKGIAVAAAALAIAAAALAVWKLPDVLPALWDGGTGETTTAETSGTTVDTTATTATQTTAEEELPFHWTEEVPGYEAYKVDLIEKSGLAGKAPSFRPEEKSYICTFKIIQCNMTGNTNDTFVVYMVAQRDEIQRSHNYVNYNYYMLYALVSNGKAMAIYMPDQEIMKNMYGAMEVEAADFNGDGRDELLVAYRNVGSSYVYIFNAYQYDSGIFSEHPLDKDSFLYSLKAIVEPEGYYVIESEDTGYRKRFRNREWDWKIADSDTRIIWDETMQDGISPETGTNYVVMDFDNDGIMEIGVLNLYYHFWHTGTCGHGVEVFKYDPSAGYFRAVWATYISSEETDNPLNGDTKADLASFIGASFQ